MKPACYTCKLRHTNKCRAYEEDFKERGGNGYTCPDYEHVLVKDAVDKEGNYRVIDDFTHHCVGEFTGEEVIKKFGNNKWYGGYTDSCPNIWIEIKEN